MSDLSRRSSRQPILADDTNSLTSFPDPAAPDTDDHGAHTRPSSVHSHIPSGAFNGLLDQAGPSMFDDPLMGITTEAQTLSAATTEALNEIIDHRGAIHLVRRLATLLAERDAHITALKRLAEEFKVPQERITDAALRAEQAEIRRLSLLQASEDVLTLDPRRPSGTVRKPSQTGAVNRNGTVRNLTRIFGGGIKQSKDPNSTIRAAAGYGCSRMFTLRLLTVSRRTIRRSDRPQSIVSADAASVQSQDSGNWVTSLFGGQRPTREVNPIPREPLELVTQHDRDQLPPTLVNGTKDPHEAQWNRFMLKMTEARTQHGEPPEGDQLSGLSMFHHQGNAGQHRLRALTQLVVGGIPINFRQPVWMELSNAVNIMTPGEYEHYLSLSQDGDQEQIVEIMKDVPRTLTTKFDFYTDKGYERLKRVLIAFVNRYEGLGYTQGLNTIAGYLLLAIPSEEDAFWMLCNLIENFFPLDYFAKSSNMYGPLADNIVLRQCIKEQMPALASHLDSIGIEHDHTVPLNWFFTAFSTVLSQEVLMRIWDVWLCLPNQRSFMFNIAMTILTKHSSSLLACTSEGEYWAYLDSCTSALGDERSQVDEFIKHAFLMRRKLEGIEDRRNVEFKVLRKKTGSTEALYSNS